MSAKGQGNGETLEEVVYLGIKAAIASGQLQPGMHLTEQAITRHFGASRTPVRAALRRLSAEGFIEYTPHRGARLALPQPAEIQQVFALRRLLEPLAARKATARVTRDLLAELEEAQCRQDDAHARRDRLQVVERATEFHLGIARAADDPWLLRFVSALLAQSNVYLLFYDPMQHDPPHAPAEHAAILERMAAGDADGAAAAMAAHVDTLERDLQIRVAAAPANPWLGR